MSVHDDLNAAKARMETARNRLSQVRRELEEMAGQEQLTAGQETRFGDLDRAVEKLQTQLDDATSDYTDAMRRGVESGELHTEPGADEVPDRVHRRVAPTSIGLGSTDGEVRSAALTTIERWQARDEFKETATAIVENRREVASDVARHILRFSDPHYVSAFRSYMEDPDGFGDTLSPAEKAAWKLGRQEARATFGLSGAVLPSPMDPTIVLSNAGQEGSLRSISKVRQTAANTYRTINSAGVTASFDAETTEVSDDTPSLAGTTITCRKAQAMVIASIEAGADQPGYAAEVANMFGDAKFRLEETNFVKGVAASNQPIGIQTSIDGGSYELGPDVAETFDADEVYNTLEGLSPRWRPNATWVLELSTLNTIRRFYNPSGSEPPLLENDRLLGLPYLLHSSVDAYSAFDAGASADHFLMFLGDFAQGFTIADRVGMVIAGPQLLQNTTNGRFDGTVGWYAYWRVGSDITADGSIVAKSIPTTA